MTKTPLDILASLQARFPLTTWSFGENDAGDPVIGFIFKGNFVENARKAPNGQPTDPSVVYGMLANEVKALDQANDDLAKMGLSARAVLCLVDVQRTLQDAFVRGVNTVPEYCKVMEQIALMAISRMRVAADKHGFEFAAPQLRAAIEGRVPARKPKL